MSTFKCKLQFLSMLIAAITLYFPISSYTYSPLSFLPDKAVLFAQINFNEKNRKAYKQLSIQGLLLKDFTKAYLGKDLSEFQSVYFLAYPKYIDPKYIDKDKKSLTLEQQRQMSYVVLFKGEFNSNEFYRQQLKNSKNSLFQIQSHQGVKYLGASSKKKSDQTTQSWKNQLRYISVLNKTYMIATLDEDSCHQVIDWFLKNPSSPLEESAIVKQKQWNRAMKNGAIGAFITVKDALNGRKFVVEKKYEAISRLNWLSFYYDEESPHFMKLIFHCQSEEDASNFVKVSKEFIVQYILPIIILASSDFSWLQIAETVQAKQDDKEVILDFQIERQQLFRLFSQNSVD